MYDSDISSYSAKAARGSIAFGIKRLFLTVNFTTLDADFSALSVEDSSPNSQSK